MILRELYFLAQDFIIKTIHKREVTMTTNKACVNSSNISILCLTTTCSSENSYHNQCCIALEQICTT